jgi:hypothetical protein
MQPQESHNQEQAPVEQPQLQHTLPEQQPQYVTNSSLQKSQKKSKLSLIMTILLFLLLLGASGYLGYMYKTTNDKLTASNTSLTQAKAKLTETEAKLSAGNAPEAFIAKYNDAKLSRSLCNGQSLGMFDVHINDKFTVFRYLCANRSDPILIGAFAKHADGSIDFSYSSGQNGPNKLPGFIYDTEPAFFGPIYGTTRF